MARNQSGWLYAVRARNAEGLVKLGKTGRPEGRLAELDNPEVLAMVFCLDYSAEESKLHRKFKAKRLPQSEFFNLSDEELSEALEILKGLHERAMGQVLMPQAKAQPVKVKRNAPVGVDLARLDAEWAEYRRRRDAGENPPVPDAGSTSQKPYSWSKPMRWNEARGREMGY